MSDELNGQFDHSVRQWKRYPAYKDSGVPWLGEIPSHWQLNRLKFIAPNIENKIQQKPPAAPYIGLENIESGSGKLLLDSLPDQVDSTVTQFKTNDVLFGKLRPYLAKVVHAPFDGVCSTEILVLRPSAGTNFSFLTYFLLADGFIRHIDSMTYGVKMPRANPDQISAATVAVPPTTEQELIACFLKKKIAKLDSLTAKKERLIDLLQEKRTALISHAVTKGLDASVPMKDSAVEWLGKIPTYWDVSSLGRHVVGIGQGWSPVADDRTAEDGEWGVVKLGAVFKGRFRSSEHKALPIDLPADERYEIREGDFLITRANTPDLVGDVCVVRSPRPKLMLCDFVYRVCLNESRINKFFLAYWLLSLAGRYQITRDARGSSQSMVKLAQRHICSLAVTLPPVTEQEAVVAYLDQETSKIDALLAKVKKGIDKLREYRTALISAAVTGKIDVREEGKSCPSPVSPLPG